MNGISLEREMTPYTFQAWETCTKCGGYKWLIGSPPTTGPVMCNCPPEIPVIPIGWVCPRCQKVLAPGVVEHNCDNFTVVDY